VVVQEVSKVFMGASGAMSNGTILARAGSASVAMVADAMQRPVIICCETLKFVDRVQLDSITYNELGDPDALAAVEGRPEVSSLQGWQDQTQLGETFVELVL
jgi:translation initiation factor eIF-2B subunit delta